MTEDNIRPENTGEACKDTDCRDCASKGECHNDIKAEPVGSKTEFYETDAHALFALLATALAICYGRLIVAFDSAIDSIGLRYALFAAMFLVVGFAYMRVRRLEISWETALFGSMTAATAVFYVLYAETRVIEPFAFVLLHLFALLFIASAGRSDTTRITDRVVPSLASAVFLSPFECFPALPSALGSFMKRHLASHGDAEKKARQKKIVEIVIGFLIAIPLVVLVAELLRSDDVFESFTKSIFRFFEEFDFSDIFRYINPVTAFMTFVIFSVLCRAEKYRMKDTRMTKPIPDAASACLTVMLLLTAVYAVFFLSQAAGISALIAARLPEDMTYSSFARSGFFELCVVSVINGAVIYAAWFLGKNKASVRVLSIVLTAVNFLLIAVAASKMGLYMQTYGFTEKRFDTLWLMAVLTVLFVFTLIKINKPSFPLSRLSVLFVCLMLLPLLFADFGGIADHLNELYGYDSAKYFIR